MATSESNDPLAGFLLPPVMHFPFRIEHLFDVAVQGTHDADPREHCWSVILDLLVATCGPRSATGLFRRGSISFQCKRFLR